MVDIDDMSIESIKAHLKRKGFAVDELKTIGEIRVVNIDNERLTELWLEDECIANIWTHKEPYLYFYADRNFIYTIIDDDGEEINLPDGFRIDIRRRK